MLRTIYGDPDRYVKQLLVADSRACISPATARAEIKTDISGSWAASTTCSTSAATASAPWKSSRALVAHEAVAEAAVVGRPDELKGQAISAFVTLEQGRKPTLELKEELRKWVAKEIGALAKPDDIRFTDTLPKTRSGKIMRRLLRELATNGEVKGDTTTLEDFSVIAKLKESDEV